MFAKLSFRNSSIRKKIRSSFILIIGINIIYGVYIFFTLSISVDTLKKVTSDINRSVEAVNSFRDMIEYSRSYTTNWIYVPKYEKDKEKLRDIHQNTYPTLKNELLSEIDTTTLVNATDSILLKSLEEFDQIIVWQKTITQTLDVSDSYDDFMNQMISQDLLDNSIIPNSGDLIEQVDQVRAKKKQNLLKLTADMQNSFTTLNYMIIFLSIFGSLIAILIANWLSKNITNPIKILEGKITLMSKGEVPERMPVVSNDEMGKMGKGINSLIESFKMLTAFSSEIKHGNLDAEFEARGPNDVLGQSLISMKNNLKRVIDETNEVVEKAGKEGILSSRIDFQNKEGAWKTLSIAINELLFSISNPLLLLNEITNAMANGDLSKRYDKLEKGEIFNLTDCLNKAIISLNDLLIKISGTTNVVKQSTTEMLMASTEMTNNISEISSVINEISVGAQNQVDKVDEVSSLIEGILNSSTEMAQKAKAINIAALDGSKSGEKGRDMIENISDNINQMSRYADKTNRSMDVLTNRSKEIARVLDVIREIANQTNLLALNAAIEAAQAGDAGRGFAVVAEEIRKLAEDSKKSASQIEQLVKDVQKDTIEASENIVVMNETVITTKKASDEAFDVFSEIEKSNTNTLEHSKEIADYSESQQESVAKVVTLTESVVVIAEETATGTEQTATGASELSAGMNEFHTKALQMEDLAIVLRDELGKLALANKN